MHEFTTEAIVSPGEPAYEVTHDVQNFSTYESRTLSSNAEWENYLGGMTSVAGARVSPYTALGISAVWQAVTLISGDIAKLPLNLFKVKSEDESPEKSTTHPGWRVASRRPNALMEFNVFQFWRRVMVFYLLYNRTWVWIQRDRLGNPIGLWPLLPSQTYSRRLEGSEVRELGTEGDLVIHTQVGNQTMTLFPEEVLYFEGISLDNEEGELFVQHARDSFGLALEQQNYASRFFRNGGRIGGFLEIPVEMSKKARDNIEKGFRDTYEKADAAFRNVTLRDNVKYRPGQHSPNESQVSEARRESVREVARRFNLHPSKLGEEAKTSYGSKAEDNRDYLDTTLSPILCQIVSEMNAKLLTPPQFRSGKYYFAHDTDRMLMLSADKRAAIWDSGIKSTWLSPNEVRRKENMPKRAGGDEFMNPNTTSGGSTETITDETVAEAHRKLLGSTLRRTLDVVRKKTAKAAKTGNDFVTWTSTELPNALRSVSDASLEVLSAHEAATGHDSEGLALYLFTQMSSDVQGFIGDICDTTCADELHEAVNLTFNSYVATAPEKLATQIIRS